MGGSLACSAQHSLGTSHGQQVQQKCSVQAVTKGGFSDIRTSRKQSQNCRLKKFLARCHAHAAAGIHTRRVQPKHLRRRCCIQLHGANFQHSPLTTTPHIRLASLVALLPALLAACGGGGIGAPESTGSGGHAFKQSNTGTVSVALSPEAATSEPLTSLAPSSGTGTPEATAVADTSTTTALLLPPTPREDDRGASAAAVNAQLLGTDAPGMKKAQAVAAVSSLVVVRARASLAGNTGAMMELRADGRLLGSAEVRATAYQDYSFTVPTLGTTSVLDVAYTNDGMVAGVDRNLWVEKITVDGITTPATAPTVRLDRGQGAAAFDGIDVLPGQSGLFWNGALRFTLRAAAAATGAGVYVDQIAGNDINPGTQNAPWKTLAKVTSVRLPPGQGVYLRCGQTWRESLKLDANQLADGSTISGYGAACTTTRAVISGADDFSGGWAKVGNIWSRAVPAGTPQITRLFINSQSQRTARWPNASATSQGYALTASNAVPSTSSAVASAADLAMLRLRDVAGATIHVRTKAWMIESRRVGSFNTTTGAFAFAPAMQYATDANEGYVLEGKLWMLDSPGEFFHDTAAGRLYVYPADTTAQANLNATQVEGSVRDTPVALADRSNVRVSGISARMGRADGFALMNMPGATVENVEGSGNAGAGIRLAQDATKAGPTVRASRFDNNWMLGIDAQFAGASVISGNTVTATGTVGSSGWSQAAIRTDAGARVQDNNIDGSAYHGVHYTGTGGSQITGNTITGYCLRLADCGGIYTWNGGKLTANQTSLIEGNQVLDAKANSEGAIGFGIEIVVGIFLDDFASGVTVRNNLAYGMPVGISVHNGWSNTVDGNKFWLNSLVALSAGMDQNDRDWMTGNVFRNNQIVPVKTGSALFPAMPTFKESFPIWFFNNLSGSAGITSGSNVFTGNQVVRLDGSLDGVHAWIRSNTQDLKLSSASWASFNPTDARTATPLTFAMYTLVLGPEVVSGGNFDAGLGSWTTWFGASTTPGSAQASGGGAGCIGTCMQLLPGTNTDYLGSPSFSLKTNAPYLYSYTARLGQAATLRFPYIGRDVTPYDSMATGPFSSSSKLSGVAGEVIRYEGFFTAKDSAPARVYLQSRTVGVPVFFDNVSVRELTGFSFSTAADWSALAYAPRSGARAVSCASLGWGSSCSAVTVDGTPVALPMTLPAGTQQLFLRSDSPWKR